MPYRGFSILELILYILPLVMILLTNKYFKSYLKYFKHWPLTLAICLLPTWLVLIYAFGWLTFGFNILPLILLLLAFTLGVQLYAYLKRTDHFYFQAYYLPASELSFVILSMHLLGLILLRWWVLIK